MARLPDQHLNLYELTLLASDEMSGGAQFRGSEAERRDLERHLLSCSECRELLNQQQFLFRISMTFSSRNPSAGDPGCPSEQHWMEIVVGLHSPAETQEQIEHAMNCTHCAALLKRLAEQYADDTTDEEASLLRGLASADTGWQQTLARTMQHLSSKESVPRSEPKAAPKRGLMFRLSTGMASAAALLLAAGWFTYYRPARAVTRLLAKAYSEQRTTELRMAGARYAPIEAFRGAEISELRRPTTLLEAEVVIAKELASKPDDPFWLDAQGRADLMDGHRASALSTLERAHRYAPENVAITIDLASAYFLRGEELKRPEDYGRAIDLLGCVLAKNPHDELARFNRALASERLLLYEQAVEDWQRYLELDPASRWSEEARKRLADLQEKIDLQKNRSERLLLGPAEFLVFLPDAHEDSSSALDLGIERYFDLALREWIPEAFSNPPQRNADVAARALDRLARILASQHADYWLNDFLNTLRHKPLSRSGLSYLEDFQRFNEIADLDRARASAIGAAVQFHKTGNSAGELMAEFASSYADQLAHQVANCLAEARARDDPRVKQRYPWLHTQLALESAACTNLNDETARKLASEALQLAKLHRYPSLELRAETFLAELYQYMGDTSSAWSYSADGLARYREGYYPPMRGYSLYVELDLAAEDSEEWFLDTQILEGASHFITDDPDLELRAMEYYRLANSLTMTGDLTAAENRLEQARALFLHSADGVRKRNLEIEAQIGLAKLDLQRSRASLAVQRLEPLRETIQAISDEDLAFDYFRNLGLAYFATGAWVQAHQALSNAVSLAEESLTKNNDERERLIWCRKADPVYRAMVELSLSESPRDAYARWEWFKGASLRGNRAANQDLVRVHDSLSAPPVSTAAFTVPGDTAIVSYAVLPEGTFAWTYNREGVRQYRLAISAQEIERLARQFADHCSRPDSAMATVVEESHALYEKLFAPMEPFLKTYKHLVVEPDLALWFVPFEALMDRSSVYLGDRYAISLSPGLDYLAGSPAGKGVTAESHLLIVGAPATNGQEPLDDAEQEAKGIARQFRYKKLLLKDDAGYARITEQLAETDVFHFSGHAAASRNGVGLLLGDSGVMDVAKIKVSEFSHLKLVVLSACNSARGTAGVFDDRDSLARLLVGAGVLEVVASRWVVNSRATAALMKEFYTQLLSGQEASSALREASQKLRARTEFAHPFYWASFSAYGKS